MLRLGLLDERGQLDGSRFYHGGRFGAAALTPFVGGGLGVDIEDGGPLAVAFGADGQMGGDGAFSSASLLADEGDGLHSYRNSIIPV